MNMKGLSIVLFTLVSVLCFSQEKIERRYMSRTGDTDMYILLLTDSTYEIKTFWDVTHGFYEIWEEKESPYDVIIFGDEVYRTNERAFFFHHISVSQEDISSMVGYKNGDSSYVAIFDLTGLPVPYYSVVFLDSERRTISTHRNEGGSNNEVHTIPDGTVEIGMTGEIGNTSSYFISAYEQKEGNIAYIIGPETTRFRITKDRKCIKYLPCHCESYESDCSVSFVLQ